MTSAATADAHAYAPLPHHTKHAVGVQVQGDNLLVANAGDSRCVVSESGKAIAMSFDHKPTDASEHSRITKVGNQSMNQSINQPTHVPM